MINKKYTATEKNCGIIPSMPILGVDKDGQNILDTRVGIIEVPCGQCIECRQSKAREWQVRLSEEIKDHKYNYFVTLTFSPKELDELCKKTNLKECNAVAGYAVRHMLERWRKTHKKSLKHWLITELGHEGTERIHLHGLIFTDEKLEFGEPDENQLREWKYWRYGHIYVGEYVNQKTINYISKYITKIDTDHKGFIGQILASPGIGKNFIERYGELKTTRYDITPRNIIDYYRLENGCKVKLPKYYKNKIYNEEQREQIWRIFMDKEKISIMGTDHSKRNISNDSMETIVKVAQKTNRELGYGNDSKEWKKKNYNITRRMVTETAKMKAYIEMYERTPAKQRTQEMDYIYYKYKSNITKMKKNA